MIKDRIDRNFCGLSLFNNGKVFLNFFLKKKMSALKRSRTHDECRLLICSCCGSKNFKCAKLTDNLEQLVKDEVYKEYSKENTSYPLGLCPSCRTSLYLAKKKGRDAVSAKVRDSWNLNLDEFRAPSRKNPCDCRVCATARVGDKKFGEAVDKELPRKPAEEEVVGATNPEVAFNLMSFLG